ncbi:MAG: hypothetical protein K0R38_1577 [Polyangiaceae bacterium]|nr:hypothetical protein [Polyangiaceae bacterium]
MSAKAKLSLLFALVACALVWGLVVWRMRHTTDVTVAGDLRVGSLTCPSACRIELTLTDGTRVHARECTLPDSLRDLAAVRVVAAGKWADVGVLDASHLFVTSRSVAQGSVGVPPHCAVRVP